MTGFEWLRKQVLDKNPMLYEEDRDGAEFYKCFWCEEYTPDNSNSEAHKEDCLYKKLKEMKV